MILKWLQTMVGVKGAPQNLGQGFSSNGVARPANGSDPASLVDVAHEVLSKEALERQAALKGFEKYGLPLINRKRLQQRIQARVKRLLTSSLAQADDFDMVDEITERIAEVAEVDPYYQKMFGDREEKR